MLRNKKSSALEIPHDLQDFSFIAFESVQNTTGDKKIWLTREGYWETQWAPCSHLGSIEVVNFDLKKTQL